MLDGMEITRDYAQYPDRTGPREPSSCSAHSAKIRLENFRRQTFFSQMDPRVNETCKVTPDCCAG